MSRQMLEESAAAVMGVSDVQRDRIYEAAALLIAYCTLRVQSGFSGGFVVTLRDGELIGTGMRREDGTDIVVKLWPDYDGNEWEPAST